MVSSCSTARLILWCLSSWSTARLILRCLSFGTHDTWGASLVLRLSSFLHLLFICLIISSASLLTFLIFNIKETLVQTCLLLAVLYVSIIEYQWPLCRCGCRIDFSRRCRRLNDDNFPSEFCVCQVNCLFVYSFFMFIFTVVYLRAMVCTVAQRFLFCVETKGRFCIPHK